MRILAFLAASIGAMVAAQALQAQALPSADLLWPLEVLPLSARASAMAESTVAVPGDVHSLHGNPAGLADVRHPQVLLHHHEWLDAWRQESAAVAFPVGTLGTLGFSGVLTDPGSLESRDEEGELLGNLRPRRYHASLGAGFPLPAGGAAGLVLRGGLQDLDGDSLSAFSADLGALWRLSPRWRAGASYTNAGPYVRRFIHAASMRAGFSCEMQPRPAHRLLACFSLAWQPSGPRLLTGGLEDRVLSKLALRAGGRLRLGDDPLEGFRSLGAGVGILLGRARLDYAFQPWGELGSSHRMDMTWEFRPAGSIPPKDPATLTPTPSMTATMTPSPTATATPVVSSTPDSPLLNPRWSWSPTPTVWIPGTDVRDRAPRENLKLYFRLPEDVASSPVSANPEQAATLLRLQERIARDPKDARAWMDLGRLQAALGEREAAIQCFEQVLRLRPGMRELKAWLDGYRLDPRETPENGPRGE